MLLGHEPVFSVEFFVVPKNETLKTNKPLALCNIINLRFDIAHLNHRKRVVSGWI